MRRALGLGGQQHALRDAKAVLLVDHRQPEPAIGDAVLKYGMGADEDVDAAIGQTDEGGLPCPPLVAPRQERHGNRQARKRLLQGREMLPREDFGRCEQRALRARLDSVQERHRRHQRLAAAHVALEQPQHRRELRHVACDLRHGARLRTSGREGQFQSLPQSSVTGQRPAPPSPGRRAQEHQRQLPSKDLIIGKALACRGCRGVVMRRDQRLPPPRPAARRQQAGFDPLGQCGSPRDRLRHKLSYAPVGDPVRQPIDRLSRGHRIGVGRGQDMVGMHDLERIAIAVEPPRDEARLAERKQLPRPAGVAAKIDARDNIARTILTDHPEWRARRPPPLIAGRGQNNPDHPAGLGGIQALDQLALHPAQWQVEGKIDRTQQAKPGQRLQQCRTDALQRLDFGKERIEYLGSHVYLPALSTRRRLCKMPGRLPHSEI